MNYISLKRNLILENLQTWQLQTSSNDAKIKFTIEHIDIESHVYGGCVYDYLEISFDDYSWKYCGNGSNSFIPDHFISSGSSMTIKFHSDRLGTKPGFFARWEEIKGMYSKIIYNVIFLIINIGVFQMRLLKLPHLQQALSLEQPPPHHLGLLLHHATVASQTKQQRQSGALKQRLTNSHGRQDYLNNTTLRLKFLITFNTNKRTLELWAL